MAFRPESYYNKVHTVGELKDLTLGLIRNDSRLNVISIRVRENYAFLHVNFN